MTEKLKNFSIVYWWQLSKKDKNPCLQHQSKGLSSSVWYRGESYGNSLPQARFGWSSYTVNSQPVYFLCGKGFPSTISSLFHIILLRHLDTCSCLQISVICHPTIHAVELKVIVDIQPYRARKFCKFICTVPFSQTFGLTRHCYILPQSHFFFLYSFISQLLTEISAFILNEISTFAITCRKATW